MRIVGSEKNDSIVVCSGIEDRSIGLKFPTEGSIYRVKRIEIPISVTGKYYIIDNKRIGLKSGIGLKWNVTGKFLTSVCVNRMDLPIITTHEYHDGAIHVRDVGV